MLCSFLLFVHEVLPMQLDEFVRLSPGFKAAVNLQMEMDNLEKVAGFIPTEVSKEIILDLARKIHPTASDLRSRLIMGTYGTGKSHLALVLANLYRMPIETPELHQVIDKLDPDTRKVLLHNRGEISKKYLIVTLYGDVGRISDALSMGLRNALNKAGLEHLLCESAYDAAIKRMEEIQKDYPESHAILKRQASERGMTLSELTGRLESYDRAAFELFCELHPSFSGGHQFVYSTMIDPGTFYRSVVRELIAAHEYAGIAVFWDEFGQKMEEVVKDPRGREGLDLQEFAECCNYSEEDQIHFYLFCHRSLKEYTARITAREDQRQQWEADLRKIEGRFKPFSLKSTDVETFQLIDSVIVVDEESEAWSHLLTCYSSYFDRTTQRTSALNYFAGFSAEEIKRTVILGTYPLHPMAVYSLPSLSERVAQNNRTLFTCLCEDEVGSLCRFIQKTRCTFEGEVPPTYTVDMLWDYFAGDVKQQEQTYPIFRDYEHLCARLDGADGLGRRILKAVSVFRVTKPTRFKTTPEILAYALNIQDADQPAFYESLERLSDHRNENRVLMRLNDGSFRTAVSNVTESLMVKIRKLLDLPITQSPLSPPVKYLSFIWGELDFPTFYEATAYMDEFGVERKLTINPVSHYQLRESLHLLTKNLGKGIFEDGLLMIAVCEDSHQLEEARSIALDTFASDQYKQIVIAIPKQPVSFLDVLLQHQALRHLQKTESSLYKEGAELYEEWRVWYEDVNAKVVNEVQTLLNPENQMLDYYWKGNLRSDILNKRKLKSLVSEVMVSSFPYSPVIGDDKLAQDNLSAQYGYKKECRDIALTLSNKDAASALTSTTSSAQKHVINLLLTLNGILQKNQAGDPEIRRPDDGKHPGAAKLWDVIAEHVHKAKRGPQDMSLLVTKLRKPPYGLKCRVMPIFFAAVAHTDLALGNISFEFHRTQTRIERISVIESDTLEKVFLSPEKYKLVYVNVSSDQKELLDGLAKAFGIELRGVIQPLERVRKVGEAMASWWRNLPRHAQLTDNVSDSTAIFREHLLKPLATVEPDIEKILLQDAFIHVFEPQPGNPVKSEKVQKAVEPIRRELEEAAENLKAKVLSVFASVFEDTGKATDEELPDGVKALQNWFEKLPDDKRNYTFNGDAAVLMRRCREAGKISAETLQAISEDIVAMKLDAWADDLVLIFQGRLHSACTSVESYKPPPPAERGESLVPPPLGSVRLTVSSGSDVSERILDRIEELGQNAMVMENMLNATLDQLGRSLDEREKMYVLYRFLRRHMFGDSHS